MTTTNASYAIPRLSRFARHWMRTNTYRPALHLSPRALAARKRGEGHSLAVVLPALNEAQTIGDICAKVARDLMIDTSLVDELVVVDGGSTDDTVAVARSAGATVVQASDILSEVPHQPGKGDSLWRSLAATKSDIVVWIDADIKNFSSHFVTRLVEPLLVDETLDFAKAFYRRPLDVGGVMMPSGGGRVTELLARPLIAMMFPELGGFVQPLSGEYAGRREVLERIPFCTGYGVEIAMLIDLSGTAGLGSLCQVDLDERVHRNRPVEELSKMAFSIAQIIMRRAEEQGRLSASIDYATHPLLLPAGEVEPFVDIERPPMELIAPYREALRHTRQAVALA
ncbi:MAG TPA: glucosyl-3-phosphoglycerate synthase [Actinomycetota bacterium]|nr:glucosyl-3-phosphoglycerate synthase [Actinomycetota bacterium]